MSISFSSSELQSFDFQQSREWLETNGLGGWASSSLSGAHTRRYHGILVAAVEPPAKRMVLVSKFDETVTVRGKQYELGCNQFGGVIHPQKFQYLQSFSHNLFPTFGYSLDGAHLSKSIVAMHGENTVLILYELSRDSGTVLLQFTPLLAGRNYHSLGNAQRVVSRDIRVLPDGIGVKPFADAPEVYFRVPKSSFTHEPDWHYKFHYTAEHQRGYDCDEDLFCPGRFAVALHAGEKLGVIISTVNPSQRDPFRMFQGEQERRSRLVAVAPARDDLAAGLHLAADQFLVERGAGLKSIIAGYHWFTDWGRDAMISLPGLCLVTGKFDHARRVLLAFTEKISRGMLPNNFGDDNVPVGYNSIDGTLWYFIALYKFFLYTKDRAFIEQMLPVLHDIIDWHLKGTRYEIHVDHDGLLAGGNPTVQLTWMDAKVGDWVVTPRQGKPVEVNALWYNCLQIMAFFSQLTGESEQAKDFEVRARVAYNRFNEIFWNGEYDCLFDCIDGANRDNKIRPNQIFALSLPWTLLSPERAAKVLKVVEQKLLTPFGLRTLDPHHPSYQGYYAGTQQTRDAAYHQGTVWSWLLGPYITALVRLEGKRGQQRARTLVERFASHLRDAGIGTVSEIFDGNEPHHPRGSIAQAWGVAEVLRAYTEDVLGLVP